MVYSTLETYKEKVHIFYFFSAGDPTQAFTLLYLLPTVFLRQNNFNKCNQAHQVRLGFAMYVNTPLNVEFFLAFEVLNYWLPESNIALFLNNADLHISNKID